MVAAQNAKQLEATKLVVESELDVASLTKRVALREQRRQTGRFEPKVGGACTVQRREGGDEGAVWLRRRGLSVGSEGPTAFSRLRRAASSLQMQQPEEPVVASHRTAKTPL